MRKNEFVAIDFEFSDRENKQYDLICCSILYGGNLKSFDLTTDIGKGLAISWIRTHIMNKILVAYGLAAEVRCLLQLFGVDNIKYLPFKGYIDLFTEHRLLANKNNDLNYGKVVAKGHIVERPYKFGVKEDVSFVNLLNAFWKFLELYDGDNYTNKEKYRDICIRNDKKEVEREMPQIIDYCEGDAMWLLDMLNKIEIQHNKGGYDTNFLWQNMLDRGLYVAITAEAEHEGYYIDINMFENLKKNHPKIIGHICDHIINNFPKYRTFTKKGGEYVYHRHEVVRHLQENYSGQFLRQFPRTEKTRKISVSKESLEKLYGSKRHNLDENDYLQMIYRYLYTKSALYGVVKGKSSSRKTMGEYIDKNTGKVHPYLNPFGSQTSRSQPAANGFLLAKPAWMRVMLSHPKDKALVCIDCGKQEVLYLAVAAQDRKLIDAYASGDPYVSFGLDVGILTEEMRGTPEWDMNRHICKTTVLMIFYGATHVGLAMQLSVGLGKKFSEVKAKRYIRQFETNYPDVTRFKKQTIRDYKAKKYLALPDNWILHRNNYNERSVANFPIQGGCAAIMRQAVMAAWRKGIVCNMTQHDSFCTYVDFDSGQLDYVKITHLIESIQYGVRRTLNWAFGCDLMTFDIKIVHKDIDSCKNKVDSSFFPGYNRVGSIEYKQQYRDPRAKKDLDEFYKYLEKEEL